jgi:hypothetical protein
MTANAASFVDFSISVLPDALMKYHATDRGQGFKLRRPFWTFLSGAVTEA